MATVGSKQKTSAKCCMDEVDLFTIPHHRMKHLLSRASQRACCTDFTNAVSFSSLLSELSKTFVELKQHEEIENKYIMKILKRKLQGEALKKLGIHLHAHSHISDILKHVKTTKHRFKNGEFTDLESEGKVLMKEMQDFFTEYIPHMTEEEEVLQPLLMEFLPVDQLKQIKDTVLHLHQLKGFELKWKNAECTFLNQFQSMQIDTVCVPPPPRDRPEDGSVDTLVVDENALFVVERLPREVLVQIFRYLGPRDLCRSACVNKEWNRMVFTPDLWFTLHLSRWGTNDWSFGSELSSDDCNCDCEPNYDLLTFQDYAEEASKVHYRSSEESDKSSSDGGCTSSSSPSSDSEEFMDEAVKREARVLNGVARYVLPKVGNTVRSVVLECSKAITNGMLFRLLSKCRNLEYLDVSQTIVSDFGLMGLVKGGCHRLQYLDVSGCKNITDKMLIKLSSALGRRKFGKDLEMNNASDSEPTYDGRLIKTLRLSGCYRITDIGLRSLGKHGGLPKLEHLDLSGCVNISAAGIRDLVENCPSLDELYFCDNIAEGSSDMCAEAAGCCQNQGCLNRVCCRNQPL